MPVIRRTGLMGLEQRVLARYRRLMRPGNERLFIGFSGGPDSLALAGVLTRIARFTGHKPVLVHVDHGLRSASYAEAQAAAESAGALGLEYVQEELGELCTTRHPGVGVEEAARRERYAVFARIVGEGGIVALAHHQSDQAETVLLHLLRGAGLRGATGMAEWTQITVPWWTEARQEPLPWINLWRPFIAEKREEVRAYAAGLGIDAVHDPSNDVPAQTRNALRLSVIPELERIQPGATAALARYGEIAALDDAYLRDVTANYAIEACDGLGGLRVESLRELPTGLAMRLIREWLISHHASVELSADRVRAVLSLAHQCASGQVIQVGGNIGVKLVGGSIRARVVDKP